jgi:hypothetical protein
MIDERAQVRAHLLALGCVALAAVLKKWMGPADPPFMYFTAAVALAAWNGGLVSGVVATLASILVVDVGFSTTAATVWGPWTAFAIEALVIAWVIAQLGDRLRAADSQLAAAHERLASVEASEYQAQLLNAAFDRLSSLTDDAAALVLNAQGLITAWPSGASRVYRSPANEMLGASFQTLFGAAAAPDEGKRLLAEALAAGRARWSGVQRRYDGTPFDADVEIRPAGAPHAFTLVVRDLTRDRQWDAFRDASARSETALRTDVDVMRQQLAALESVTDPALDPLRQEDVEQLLERLRLAVDADGVAFVQPAAIRNRIMTANGLQPTSTTLRALEIRRANNRVLLVQNDPTRVAQLSQCAWPDSASCLIGVPVIAGGQVRSAIEVVNERPRRSTDADMALIRVVANRVAAFGADNYGEARTA